MVWIGKRILAENERIYYILIIVCIGDIHFQDLIQLGHWLVLTANSKVKSEVTITSYAYTFTEKHASHGYRLTRDDAEVVQIIHTNAGTLGQQSLTGSVDLCINGGSLQPFCRRGLRLSRFHISSIVQLEFQMDFHSLNFFFSSDRNRCSHFLSVCYLANAIFKHKLFPYKSCPNGCVKNNSPLFGFSKYSFKAYEYSSLVKLMHIGQDVPEEWVFI